MIRQGRVQEIFRRSGSLDEDLRAAEFLFCQITDDTAGDDNHIPEVRRDFEYGDFSFGQSASYGGSDAGFEMRVVSVTAYH